MIKNYIEIYTDGACKGNPGKGGWAAILSHGDYQKELFGSEENTTNNRMEMLAVIHALEAIKTPCPLRIYTDSQYVSKGIQEWLPNWRKNNFYKNDGQPVKNVDLWKQLDQLSSGLDIEWKWVRGHDGNDKNERADFLASQAAIKQNQSS